jgi:hypothetical protein
MYDTMSLRWLSPDLHWHPGNMIYGDNPKYLCNSFMPDITAIMQSSNRYAYCGKNPLKYVDQDGEIWHILGGAVVGGILGGIAQLGMNVVSGKKLTDNLGSSMLMGVAGGALAATGVGLIGLMAGNATIAMTGKMANQIITNKGLDNFDIGSTLVDGAIGAAAGLVGGRGFCIFSQHTGSESCNTRALILTARGH